MTDLAKHPFSLYDFLGYMIPGIYVGYTLMYLDYLFFFKDKSSASLIKFLKINYLIEHYGKTEYLFLIVFIFVVFLYIFGQILSILSNIIIEELPFINSIRKMFSISLGRKQFQKNSEDCILNKILRVLYLEDKDYLENRQSYWNKFFFLIKTLTTNMIFWVIPIFFPLFAFVVFFSPYRTIQDDEDKLSLFNNFFRAQPLATNILAFEKIKNLIEKKYHVSLNEDLGIDVYFHYVYHLVLEKCNAHFSKINNYVALYGFMRNMLMGNIILFYYSAYVIATSLDSGKYLPIIIFSILNVVYVYGYIKYVRRYTEEIIFASCTL